MKRLSLLPGLVVVLAGLITGLFSLNFAVGISNAQNNMGLSILVIVLFIGLFLGVWQGLCSFIVKKTKVKLGLVRKKQSIPFLSFFVLALFPITSLVVIPAQFSQYSSLPSLLLLLFALSVWILLSMLLLDIEIKSRTIPIRWVYGVSCFFFVVVTLLAVFKHLSFYSTGFDLGLYNQVIFGLSNGADYSSVLGYTIFGDHVQPILFLLLPFYVLFSSPLTLVVIQSLAIAVGSIPLFLLARKYLKHDVAVFLLFLAYFFAPAFWYPALFDFHPLVLAVPFLMYAVYYLFEKRYGLMILFLVFAGICKENLPLVLVPFGIYIFLKDRKRVMGSILAIVGIAWVYLNIEIIIPHFYEQAFRYYNPDFGGSLSETLISMVTQPIDTIRYLLSFDKIAFLGLFFSEYGMGLLSLFGLPVLLLGATEFGILLVYQQRTLPDIVYHHQSNAFVFVILSALFGIVFLAKYLPRWVKKLKLNFVVVKNIVPALAIFALATSVLSFSFYGPFALLYDVGDFNPGSDYVANGNMIIDLVPDDATVAAANWVLPHLSNREYVYRIKDMIHKPEVVAAPEYIVLELSEARNDPKRSALLVSNEEYHNLVTSEEYGVIAVEGTWVLLEQGADYSSGLCLLKSLVDEKVLEIDLSC
ncbi:MAG: DUF2079 domain-containing protein [Nanoarchaeota archaeon]|nr:DUF2079 domain-containing protein [Nanoarchaeota archaeon]